MAEVWVAAAGLAVSAAGTAYGVYSQSKASKAAEGGGMPGGGVFASAFGEVPEAAEYRPVNFKQTQLDTITDNRLALPDIGRLVSGANNIITRDALTRADKLIPSYRASMDAYGRAGNELLNGRLPFEDVLGIVSDRNELANALGTPGAAGNATLKDLGISRLGAIQSGGGILKDMVGIAETISPINRYMKPQDMMLDPATRIGMEMQQNQLIQQSDQNRNNLEAAGDPAAYAQLQLALAQAGRGSTAGAGSDPIGGYIGAAGQLLSGFQSLRSQPNYSPTSTGWSGYLGQNAGLANRYPAYYNGVVIPRASAV